ncbi:long-chain-fatty-acid--coa ligase [hydrocarbon metagenome]|uniref:Long-chain-fatty-acid--coa ligase n=1 Tax=hydrocarbon metagenome TaxID=938273 RepID=A0A0W8FQY7_9ZZZZ
MSNNAFSARTQTARLLLRTVRSIAIFLKEEARRGTLMTNLKGFSAKDIVEDMSWSDLLEERACMVPYKTFLMYKNERFTYAQMDANANRMANFLLSKGGGKGLGLAIFMKNSPRFLDIFFGAQKIGMYLVPLNPELKGDNLKYVIEHSDVSFLALDAELLDGFTPIASSVKLKGVFVDDIEEESRGFSIPSSIIRLSEAYAPRASTVKPKTGYNKQDMCLIMYTSGTSGRRKGVVYRYYNTTVKKLCIMSNVILNSDDVCYTPLALIHGNALFLTITTAMAAKASVALSRKFSASKFWEEVRTYNATTFNTLGSMIPILMKQPPKPNDADNKVRYVLSAACPAEMWGPFEKRFGLKIYEGYGAVDGGGKAIMNFGTAPAGSLGKPIPPAKPGEMRLVDAQGKDVPTGIPGELIFKVSGSKGRVEYYKNEEASNEKVHDGFLYTGDLVRMDEQGYLYFVGRNTESMRRGGENVSAYEVEHAIMEHPAVEEVAVYAVPSELAEDEIMASIKLVQGQSVRPQELIAFMQDKLERFAVPRYIRFVNEFPMTNTHRIIKKELEKIGVTEDTFDAQKNKG